MKIVFLNGPPGCGKDTAVSHLVPYLHFAHLKFAAPIKRMVCGLLNEDTRWLEENKDVRHRTLALADGAVIANTDTPRQLLIALSEELLKRRYGSDFFGRVMVNEISKTASKLVLISDSGFLGEAEPVIRKFGPPNCLQIQLSRDGCTFAGDSRSYWERPGIVRRLIVNRGSIHELTMSVLYAIMKHHDVELLKEPSWIK
jgi:hypothetical protein